MSNAKKHCSIGQLNSAIERKAQKLKDAIDLIQDKLCLEYKCFFIHQFCKQMKKMMRFLIKVKIWWQTWSVCLQTNSVPSFCKKCRSPKYAGHASSYKTIFALCGSDNWHGELEWNFMLHWITQGGKRQARKERLLTRMPATVLQGTYKVKELKYCRHMSFVESDQLWISDSVISRSIMDQCLRSKTNRLDRSKEKSWIFDTCTFECYTIMRKIFLTYM